MSKERKSSREKRKPTDLQLSATESKKINEFRKRKRKNCSEIELTAIPLKATKFQKTKKCNEIPNIEKTTKSPLKTCIVAPRNICRLCVNFCNGRNELYDKNGDRNKLYEIIKEYLHPKIVDLEKAKHLTSICSKCWQRITDFKFFQNSMAAVGSELAFKQGFATRYIEEEGYETKSDLQGTLTTQEHNIKVETRDGFFKHQDCQGNAIQNHNQTNKQNMQHFVLPKLEITDVNTETASHNYDFENISLSKLEITDVNTNPSDNDDEKTVLEFDSSLHPDKEQTNRNFIRNFRQKYEAQTIDDILSKVMPFAKCFLCSTTFETFSALKLHFVQKHCKEEFYFQCFCSEQKMKNNDFIKAHLLMHSDTNYFKCEICDHNGCKCLGSLYTHLSVHHGQYLQNNCTICRKSFASKAGLTMHYNRMHKDMKGETINVDIFDKTLHANAEEELAYISDNESQSQFAETRRHTSSAEAQTNEQFIIDIRWNYKEQNLDDIIAKTMPNIKCEQCLKVFTTFSSLKSHFYQQHPNEDFYITCFCSSEQIKKKQIKDHFLIHIDPDAFKCGICKGISYKYMITLMSHFSQHHGEYLQNVCSICKKCFATRSGLSNHIMVHTERVKKARPKGVKKAISSDQAELNAKFIADIRLKYIQQPLDDLVSQNVTTFECRICSISLQTFSSYRSHFHKEHTNETFYITCFCSDVKMSKFSPIKDHFLLHNQADFFKCGICGHNKCKSMFALVKHFGVNHRESMQNICSICGKSVSSAKGLGMHYQKIHRDFNFLTNSSFNTSQSKQAIDVDNNELLTELQPSSSNEASTNFVLDFNRSYKRINLDNIVANFMPTIKCALCSESFETITILRTHFSDCHDKQQFYIQCSCSSEKFTRASRIKDHFLIHKNPDFFKCGICGLKTWKTKDSLNKHLTSRHGDCLKCVCTICDKSFHSRRSLSLHCALAHKKS